MMTYDLNSNLETNASEQNKCSESDADDLPKGNSNTHFFDNYISNELKS